MLSGFFLHIIAWGMAKGKVTAYHITNKTTAHHEEHEEHEERIRIIFRFKKQRA